MSGKQFETSVPIINQMIDDENRGEYLRLLKAAKADRVILAFRGVFACNIPDLYANIRFFRENGFDVGLWCSHTVGHVGTEFEFAEKDLPYQRIVRRDGVPFENTFCPYDTDFQNCIADKLAEIVKGADVKIVMLDDDLTVTQKGIGCTCPKHLSRIYELLGETLPREELVTKVFSGGRNRYRTAWMTAQADSITDFAKTLRQKVSKVRPDVSLSVCKVSAHWSLDGLDNIALTRLLSGEKPLFQRVHGAPFWSGEGGCFLSHSIETARLYASFYRGSGVPTAAEGDVYPRPRTNVSASRLEAFDAAVRADGNYDGILKYMINYRRYPGEETGYIDRHARDLPVLEKISEYFAGGADTGVNIRVFDNLAWDFDIDADPDLFNPPELTGCPECCGITGAEASAIFALSGIPTVYNRKSLCDVVFGENARHFPWDDLADGVVLDAKAALLYTSFGCDVGISRPGTFEKKRVYSLHESDHDDGDRLIQDGTAITKLLDAELTDGAVPVLFASTRDGEQPLGYTYRTPEGKRLFVLLADGYRLLSFHSYIPCSYQVQRTLQKVIPWLSCRPLPIVTTPTPQLYTLVREEEKSTSVLLCNLSEDPMLTPTFTLADSFDSLACAGGIATLSGNELTFRTDIPAFGFAALRLTKA